MSKGLPVSITGTVDGLNVPAEWKEGRFGKYKVCGILLKDCTKEGISWVNYFWNEKSKSGDLCENPFGRLKRGDRYTFVCTTSVYNDKIQYSPVSYERVSSVGGETPAGPRHTEEEQELDEPISDTVVSTPVTVPTAIQAPKFKMAGYLIQDENGMVYEVKA